MPECHFNLAQAYNDLADFDNAQKHYMKALELDSGNTKAYLQLGSIYEKKLKWNLASQIYDRVLSLDPGNPQALDAHKRIL